MMACCTKRPRGKQMSDEKIGKRSWNKREPLEKGAADSSKTAEARHLMKNREKKESRKEVF